MRSDQIKYEYTSIRVETIEFQNEPATAVFFENVTQNVNCLILESNVLKEKNRSSSLESYTGMFTHEFRTPL